MPPARKRKGNTTGIPHASVAKAVLEVEGKHVFWLTASSLLPAFPSLRRGRKAQWPVGFVTDYSGATASDFHGTSVCFPAGQTDNELPLTIGRPGGRVKDEQGRPTFYIRVIDGFSIVACPPLAMHCLMQNMFVCSSGPSAQAAGGELFSADFPIVGKNRKSKIENRKCSTGSRRSLS